MTIPEFFTVRGIPGAVKDEFKLTCLKRKERIGQVISSLMIDYIALSGFETCLWPGFERVPWASRRSGDEVWIAGAMLGQPFAYGPHVVVKDRVLCNKLGEEFKQHQDVLLRKV